MVSIGESLTMKPDYLLFLAAKVVISAVLIVAVAEIAKRSALFGGFLASLPVVSVLAILWLYVDTKDPQKISDLSTSIFWMVLPSLLLFVVLPYLLKFQINFYLALLAASCASGVGYLFVLLLVTKGSNGDV